VRNHGAASKEECVPTVLVSDALAPEGVAILKRAAGLTVVERTGMKPAELLEAVRDIDGLVVRSSTRVTAELIAAAPKLRVVGRAGIGVDNVDVAAATARGIAVVNTPEGNNVTTAEHALALLVSLARHVPQATASLKAGKWEKGRFSGTELWNRTLGVIGLGNIGRIVADRARGLRRSGASTGDSATGRFSGRRTALAANRAAGGGGWQRSMSGRRRTGRARARW
jgi:D-3-phosphoglycerate dehydrogenase